MKPYARYSWAVVALTLGVILWGAYVRASGSGAGCGDSWPACNSEVIPRAKSVQTIIEFTHRATSGLAFLAVLAQFVWARRAFDGAHPARRAAAAGLFFMITEALVGAMLVKFRLVAGDTSVARAFMAALHLTNTFLLVAALSLGAHWASGGKPLARRPPAPLIAAGLGALGGTLLLGMSGAITALGDTLFPSASLIEGVRHDFSASAHFLVRLRVLHPVLGLGVCAYLFFAGGFLSSRRPSPEVRRLSSVAVGLFLTQVAVGFANLSLLAPVSLQIVHLLVADLVWISLTLLVASSLAEQPA